MSSTEKFLVQGVKINTPHYLAKLPKMLRGTSTYTVIVSQLDSLSSIYYTLRVRNFQCKLFVLYDVNNHLLGVLNLFI